MSDYHEGLEEGIKIGKAEAAARIAELEAALRKLYAHEGERVLNSIGIECYTEELEAALDEARAALAGGKKDEAAPRP